MIVLEFSKTGNFLSIFIFSKILISKSVTLKMVGSTPAFFFVWKDKLILYFSSFSVVASSFSAEKGDSGKLNSSVYL